MPLYEVQHNHSAESCPASQREMAQALLSHLAPANAEKYGVKIHADYVLPGEHTLILVLEADGPDKVTNFALPFLQTGSISVRAVSTCEQVVEAGRC
ncbi:MAG: DUF3303 domain-containing protein [Dehalococcoidia bacterium]